MKKNTILFILIALTFSCQENNPDQIGDPNSPRVVTTDLYELIIPSETDQLLILFPCMPCNAERTKQEFDIVDHALQNNVALLFMNFNSHLWLSNQEKKELESIIIQALNENEVNKNNVSIGGFSSGGNVTLLFSNYLKKTESELQPKGIFIVDSPIDLLALYESAEKTIEKNYSQTAINEAHWIIDLFESEFGKESASLKKYEEKSPYIYRSNCLNNLSSLEGVKIRMYSEPDTLWWWENKRTEYENMNSFYIEQLETDLVDLYGSEQIEYIRTENKGYRGNGDRHPHSWSIVDPEELMTWLIGS